jgi:hypothetical protein
MKHGDYKVFILRSLRSFAAVFFPSIKAQSIELDQNVCGVRYRSVV